MAKNKLTHKEQTVQRGDLLNEHELAVRHGLLTRLRLGDLARVLQDAIRDGLRGHRAFQARTCCSEALFVDVQRLEGLEMSLGAVCRKEDMREGKRNVTETQTKRTQGLCGKGESSMCLEEGLNGGHDAVLMSSTEQRKAGSIKEDTDRRKTRKRCGSTHGGAVSS